MLIGGHVVLDHQDLIWFKGSSDTMKNEEKTFYLIPCKVLLITKGLV